MNHILFLLSFVGTVLWGAPIELGKCNPKVEFLATGKPSALKIRGSLAKAEALAGTLNIVDNTLSGTASVSLNEFQTGIDLRDQHLKEKYLETAKFPKAELVLNKVPLTGDPVAKEFSWSGPFEGMLLLHGVKKTVKGQASLEKSAERWAGTFAFDLELVDFGIEIPSYLGITVSKNVRVDVSFKQ